MSEKSKWSWSDVKHCREVDVTLSLARPVEVDLMGGKKTWGLMRMLGVSATKACVSARKRIVRATGYPHLTGGRVRRVRLLLEQAHACYCVCPEAVRRVVPATPLAPAGRNGKTTRGQKK